MRPTEEIRAKAEPPQPSPAMVAGGLIAWLFVGSTVLSLLIA